MDRNTIGDFDVFEIIIEPCYVLYKREKDTSLVRLHSLWQDYHTDWCNGDIQMTCQAWHGIRAVVQILRDRGEWDEDNMAPKPFLIRPKTGHVEIECFFCHCQCSWDEDAFGRWDGECPACGTALDVTRTKEAS